MENTTRLPESLQDLYNFFAAIPDEQWLEGQSTDFDGRCCALGHIGRAFFGHPMAWPERSALVRGLGLLAHEVAGHNDGDLYYFPAGATPKQRVLNFLSVKMSSPLPEAVVEVAQYATA